jgi:chemotaxis methyl-accepting protein methylase
MPEALLSLARHPYVRQPEPVVEEREPEEQLRLLLAFVRAHTKRDFTSYKKRTLLRRIQRRMGLHRVDSLGEYVERLRNDPNEIKALAADLTINVTGFFRDPEAWQTLAGKVVAPLVKERPTDAPIRVWIPACSTGEEAYSIAMLVTEQAEAAGKAFDLKVFATDVTEGVLSSARAGQYPSSIAIDVGEQRLQRFFEMQDDTYCVKKTLREAIIFAPQNLLQDPPFSRMDLISCRNLLIYLEPDFQKRVLALFHFALREGGHLFLGPAETATGAGGAFPGDLQEVADLSPDWPDPPRGRRLSPDRRRGVARDRRARSGGCGGRASHPRRRVDGPGAARALCACQRPDRRTVARALPARADGSVSAAAERRAILQLARHGARRSADAAAHGGAQGARHGPGGHDGGPGSARQCPPSRAAGGAAAQDLARWSAKAAGDLL